MTKKPLSSISFNTSEYLDMRLSSLVQSSKIETYMYIPHHPEKDTTKPHFHFVLVPSRPIDPVSLRKDFMEFVSGEDLPRCCLPFQVSKVHDWILYALHYPPYLLSKGLVRLNTYKLSDIRTNEQSYYLDQLFSEASEQYETSRTKQFLDRMRHGDSFGDILASGLVPPSQVVYFDKLFRLNAHLIGSSVDSDGNDTFDIPNF